MRVLAEQWLARSTPPNWALEWSLPIWLGEALGVPASASWDLTLANVLGLTYVRLQDALSDGDISPPGRPPALALAPRLFEHWKAVYAGLLADDPQFWLCFERSLAQWTRALTDSDRLPVKPFAAYDAADFLALGHRGAPLKICAAASCVLAGREAILPDIEAALDELLVGAVLLDHAMDWAADLRAGRPNAFVAYASPRPQTAEQQGANREAVLAVLAVGDGGRAYFRTIAERLRLACEHAEALRLSTLVGYEAWLRDAAARFGRRFAREPRLQLRAFAGALLAGPDVLPNC